MIELEDRLRAELTRSVASVRPAPDPLRRLLARRRRRRQGRIAVALAVVVMSLLGGAMTTAGQPTPPDGDPDRPPVTVMLDEPITSAFTRALLAAPTRGNLAVDTALVAELTRELAGRQDTWHVDPSLNRVKVLLLADVPGARIAEISYYSDTRAVQVSLSGPTGTSVRDLVDGRYGGGVMGLRPFFAGSGGAELTGKPPYAFVVALAPPGCVIATSNQARFRTDGTVERTWVDQGDVVVRPGKDNMMWWRFTCAGVVRDVESGSSESAVPARLAGPPVTERGAATTAEVTGALAQWRSLPGLVVDRHRALWGGVPPGGTKPVVVLLGESAGGVQVCAVTGSGSYAVLGKNVPGGPFDMMGGRPLPEPAPGLAVTTAVAASADLVAVRLPDPANAFLLSDRWLVIGPAGATALRVSGGTAQSVPLVAGVGVVTAKVPAGLTLVAVDAAGATLARATITEPEADGLLFGQALLKRWS